MGEKESLKEIGSSAMPLWPVVFDVKLLQTNFGLIYPLENVKAYV